jgi:hypothetical protein
MVGLLKENILHLRIWPIAYRAPDYFGKYRVIAGAAEVEEGHHLVDRHELPIFQIGIPVGDDEKHVDVCGGLLFQLFRLRTFQAPTNREYRVR